MLDNLKRIVVKKRVSVPILGIGIFCLLIIGTVFFLRAIIYQPISLKKETSSSNEQYLKGVSATDYPLPALSLLKGESILPQAPPFNVSGKVFGSFSDTYQEVREYIVQSGDTLSGIASQFNISLKTLLYANKLTVRSRIKPGQKLIILPGDGILHIVTKGETLTEIAKVYKAKVEDIISANDISDDGKIYIGDVLFLPGAQIPKGHINHYKKVPLARSFFICPIPAPCRMTQGLHWVNAVDFSNGICGQPVFAAAAGTIQKVGYTSIGGNYVRILHPNGVITYYGHLLRSIVSPGQRVYQGQIIGYVGHTGYTIPRGPRGCHVHFDVRFAENPFAKYPVGTCFGK